MSHSGCCWVEVNTGDCSDASWPVVKQKYLKDRCVSKNKRKKSKGGFVKITPLNICTEPRSNGAEPSISYRCYWTFHRRKGSCVAKLWASYLFSLFLSFPSLPKPAPPLLYGHPSIFPSPPPLPLPFIWGPGHRALWSFLQTTTQLSGGSSRETCQKEKKRNKLCDKDFHNGNLTDHWKT